MRVRIVSSDGSAGVVAPARPGIRVSSVNGRAVEEGGNEDEGKDSGAVAISGTTDCEGSKLAACGPGGPLGAVTSGTTDCDTPSDDGDAVFKAR